MHRRARHLRLRELGFEGDTTELADLLVETETRLVVKAEI